MAAPLSCPLCNTSFDESMQNSQVTVQACSYVALTLNVNVVVLCVGFQRRETFTAAPEGLMFLAEDQQPACPRFRALFVS